MYKNTEEVSSIVSDDAYSLIMLLNSYDSLKRRILIALAHIFPQEATVTDISRLAGYSIKANIISRKKPLEQLETDGLLEIERRTPRHYSIRLNAKHHLMSLFVDLCVANGGELTDYFFDIIQNTE